MLLLENFDLNDNTNLIRKKIEHKICLTSARNFCKSMWELGILLAREFQLTLKNRINCNRDTIKKRINRYLRNTFYRIIVQI